jgi:regulating synaptic membrane exocytosis protein 2
LKLPHEHQFAEFIEGLGASQLVGRQVLASPCHGEIQVGLREQQKFLEVEIVRARNLLQKPVYKMPPGSFDIRAGQCVTYGQYSSSLCESLSIGWKNLH